VSARGDDRREADRFVAEALRVNTRYVEEIVIGWDLCPWAARAWQDGQVVQRVFAGAALDPAPVAAFIDELCARPDAAIGLAIFPRVEISVGAWEKFAERVRRTRRAFLTAAFHPDYCPDDRPDDRAAEGVLDAARLVPLVRRTPDPTLQLVRASLIERLGGDVSAGVGRANLATVTARGLGALDALLADIRRDRDAAYSRF
jgi:hypothetical protein